MGIRTYEILKKTQRRVRRLCDLFTELLGALQEMQERIESMTAQLQQLIQKVEQNTTVTQSVISTMEGLAQQIRDLKDDPAALEQLATQIEQNSQQLADAVNANTTPAAQTAAKPSKP